MAGHGDFAKRQDKKPKQNKKGSNTSQFSSAPVFVAPQVIKKERKEK